jgi:hypothetical protein
MKKAPDDLKLSKLDSDTPILVNENPIKVDPTEGLGRRYDTEPPAAPQYHLIRQGTATNTLTKINTNATTIDDFTGTATITQGALTLAIADYLKLSKLKTSTMQLLDIIGIISTENSPNDPAIKLSLNEYMLKRGLKDRKEARKQVANDLDLLTRARIMWTGKKTRKNDNIAPRTYINIADFGALTDDGTIFFTFGNAFFEVYKQYALMYYPPLLLKLNSNDFPNAYSFGRKIAEHKRMNNGKKNEDIIAVKTLLAIAPKLPTYEEVKATDRAFDRRIIERFERDMNALDYELQWEYCHRNNEPLTEEELATFNYSLFETLMIKITWKNYPKRGTETPTKAKQSRALKKDKKRV